MMRRLVSMGLLALAAFGGGCQGVRFIVDAVPVTDELSEAEVLDDGGRAGWGSAKIAMIDVDGIIADVDREGFFGDGENPISLFSESLRKAEEDGRVEAVIIRINSPGGTVTASDVMYRELTDFRQRSGKPVVVLMRDVAASGGYYLACAGDEIIAHPTTVTGSIGVIMQMFNVSQGLSRIGVHAEAITSGPNKEMGSPFAMMSAEHRELLQGLVDEFYDGFVTIVRANRPITEADLAWVTDGRVVSGVQAAQVGLVDGVGDLRDAFEVAKRRAGVSTARLVKYHRPLDYVGSAYSRTPAPPATVNVNLLQLDADGGGMLNSQPMFLYLWDPTAW